MTDDFLAPLAVRALDLATQLDAEEADATALKHRIYLLHRAVEEQALAVEQLQGEVKRLVATWKTRFRGTEHEGASESPPSVDPSPTSPDVVTPPAVRAHPAPADDLVAAAQRVLRQTPLLSIAIPSPVIAMAAVPAERPASIVVAAAPRDGGTATPPDGTTTRLTPRPGQPRVVDELNASTFVDRGWSRLAVGDFVAAEVALRKAIELNPLDAYAAVLLAWAEVAQERTDDALARLADVLAAAPTHALGHVVAGHAHLRAERYVESDAHLAQARALDGDRKASLYAWYYTGQLRLATAAWDDAIVAFAKALEYGPNLVEARYETGHAHWGAGRPDEARAAWRAGADANKFNPWSARCREMLAVLDAGGSPSRAG